MGHHEVAHRGSEDDASSARLFNGLSSLQSSDTSGGSAYERRLIQNQAEKEELMGEMVGSFSERSERNDRRVWQSMDVAFSALASYSLPRLRSNPLPPLFRPIWSFFLLNHLMSPYLSSPFNSSSLPSSSGIPQFKQST